MNKDGGCAFPAADPETGTWLQPGMSLRDYFAAKAMQGLCSKENTQEDFKNFDLNTIVSQIAFDSYAMADAMLKQREAQS